MVNFTHANSLHQKAVGYILIFFLLLKKFPILRCCDLNEIVPVSYLL
jgi:hypothetical protein